MVMNKLPKRWYALRFGMWAWSRFKGREIYDHDDGFSWRPVFWRLYGRDKVINEWSTTLNAPKRQGYEVIMTLNEAAERGIIK